MREAGSRCVRQGGSEQWLLIVEDDPELRQALVDVVADEGYCVVAAAHGRLAWDLLTDGAHRARPFLVIADVRMPVMGGLELLARMRSDPALRTIPTCMLSTDLVEAPVDERLAKPVRLDKLFAIIERYWRRAEGARPRRRTTQSLRLQTP